MPYGSLLGVLVFGALVALTLVAPQRPRWLAGLAYRVASAYNEAPFPFLFLLVGFSVGPLANGRLESSSGRVLLGLTSLVAIGLLVIAWRGARERPVIEQALNEGLGSGWREAADARLIAGIRKRPPLARILFMPFVLRPFDVRRVRDVPYGEAGRENLLDVYHHRSQPAGAPVLVHFHGGGYYGGRKSFESRALLFRLAARGWVTVSANYRLRPEATFLDHLMDVKKVIAWAREHAREHGADSSTLILSGGSAGGHLSSIAALTQNDPRYQPGFEAADTSVAAAVSLYGWYGGYYGVGGPTSEAGVLGHPTDDAPPFFIAHGAEDTLATIDTVRRFVAHLRAGSPNPVVFAELPHGQHGFDLFHSFRFSAVVDAIEAFTAWVRTRNAGGEPAYESSPEPIANLRRT